MKRGSGGVESRKRVESYFFLTLTRKKTAQYNTVSITSSSSPTTRSPPTSRQPLHLSPLIYSKKMPQHARSEMDTMQKQLDEAMADLKSKKDRVDVLKSHMMQLSRSVQVQSDPIRVLGETSDQNHNHTCFNHQQQTNYSQPSSMFGNSTFQNAPAPPAGPVHTRSDMPAPAPYRMQPSQPFRHYGVVPPERSQMLPANPFGKPAYNAFHPNDGGVFPPSQRQNLPLAHVSKGPRQDSIPGPDLHGQRLNPLPGSAHVRQPKYPTYATMSYLNNHAAAAQNSNWRADTIRPSTQAGPSVASSTLMFQDQSGERLTWSGLFTRFFRLTQDWARNYTNVPIMAKDSALPAALMEAFANQSEPEYVMHLLCSSATRYMLIAKMVNVWITNDVFRPRKTKGFYPWFDTKIRHLRARIRPNMSLKLRHVVLRDMIDAGKELISTEHFKTYIEQYIADGISDLWDRLDLVFAPGISKKQAWDDLNYVFTEAYRIAVLMECTTLNFGLVYPPFDQEKLFHPRYMINRDFAYREGPLTLRRRRMRVCLGYSPVIVVTDFSASRVETITIHLASVLLMQ